jgi:hypothetical protein
MRRIALAALFTTMAGACALLADLPDYEERRGDGGVVTNDAPTATDGPPGDGGGTKPDAAHLSCGASPPPIAHYRLDEGSGTTIFDCTTGGHDGTLTGAASWTTGRVGPFALSFDGGMVNLGSPPAFDIGGAMTIAAWVRVDTFATSGRILVRSGGPSDRGWQLNVEPAGLASFQLAVDAMVTVEVNTPIPAGQWLHLAGVFEPSVSLRLYVDGVERAILTSGVPAMQRTSTQPAALGRRPDGCCDLRGSIDDVRLFGRALAASDIAILAAQ